MYRLVHLVPVIFMIQQLNCVASSMLLSGSEQLFYLPLCASESILCRYGIWLQFQLFMEWQCSFTWWQLWLVQKVRHALMHTQIDTIGSRSKLFIFGSYFSFSRYHSFWCFSKERLHEIMNAESEHEEDDWKLYLNNIIHLH